MAQPTDSAGTDAILRIDRDYVQEEMDGDVAKLDRIFADDLRYTGFGGSVVLKQQILASVQDPEFSVGPIDLREMIVRLLGNDVAVVTGWADLRINYREEDYSGAYRFTRIYQRRNGEWKMIAGHTSRVP